MVARRHGAGVENGGEAGRHARLHAFPRQRPAPRRRPPRPAGRARRPRRRRPASRRGRSRPAAARRRCWPGSDARASRPATPRARRRGSGRAPGRATHGGAGRSWPGLARTGAQRDMRWTKAFPPPARLPLRSRRAEQFGDGPLHPRRRARLVQRVAAQAVAQRRQRDPAHVLGRHLVRAVEAGERAGGAQPASTRRATRRCRARGTAAPPIPATFQVSRQCRAGRGRRRCARPVPVPPAPSAPGRRRGWCRRRRGGAAPRPARPTRPAS